jgi:hypothetical protein
MPSWIFRYFVPVVVLLSANGPRSAQADGCLGPLTQPHPHPFGSINFATNSLHEDVTRLPNVTAAGGFKFGIVSCVNNPDPSYPLRVDWLIPGPDGWVQPKDILNSVPRLTNEEAPLPLDGCLQYGNRGDTTLGKFFGVLDDQSKVDREQQRGCRKIVSDSNSSTTGTIQRIILKIKNFFPSDVNNPSKTMLKLEGIVGVDSKGPEQYISFFTYEIVKSGNSDGSVEKVSMRPVFIGETEALLTAFEKKNDPQIKVTSSGVVVFEVVGVKNPKLEYASYQIIDQNKQVVGSISFPVFVSGPSQ